MSNDLISRQAAIEALRTCYDTHTLYDENNGDDYILYDEAVGEIENLPSIQPKTGHWIEDAKTYYGELKKRSLGVDEYTPYFTDDIACSECLAKYSVLDNETQFFKYCPNCGAKMEDNENE